MNITGKAALALGLAAIIASDATAQGKRRPAPRKAPVANITVCNPPHKNCINGDTLTLYFGRNSNMLRTNDLIDIKTLKDSHPKVKSWTVEGYASEEGPLNENLALSDRRASGVLARIGGAGYKSVWGATRATQHTRDGYPLDRRTRLYPTPQQPDAYTITESLEKMPKGDVYLFDLSGSMAGAKWAAVKAYKAPPKARRYTFNSCDGVREMTANSQPDCETPLWSSTTYVINRMTPGQKLILQTDGEDDGGTAGMRSTLQAALNKHVQVWVIGVGVSAANEAALADLAIKSGGNYHTSRQ